eukprot:1735202-Prymnesium_polylepis.1
MPHCRRSGWSHGRQCVTPLHLLVVQFARIRSLMIYVGAPSGDTCRALQGYAIRARGTDPRPNTPLPVG